MKTANIKKKVSILSPCFRGETYLEAFLENMAQQTIFEQCEIVLDHNEPTCEELQIVLKFKEYYNDQIIHHIRKEVIPVACSINHCMELANGEYFCIGNIDDLRKTDSIVQMCKTLDENPEVGFTYGDHIEVRKIGSKTGELKKHPEYDSKLFLSDFYLGPFFMFRRSLLKNLYGFDEQFKSAGDLDFQIRMSLISIGKKTPGITGYYLNIGQGASTGGSHLRKDIGGIERHVIYLRYGQNYERLDMKYVLLAKKYDLFHIIYKGKKISIKKLIPQYQDILNETKLQRDEFEESYRNKLVHYYVKMVILGKIRGIFKKVLSLFGLLKPMRKLLGRDP